MGNEIFEPTTLEIKIPVSFIKKCYEEIQIEMIADLDMYQYPLDVILENRFRRKNALFKRVMNILLNEYNLRPYEIVMKVYQNNELVLEESDLFVSVEDDLDSEFESMKEVVKDCILDWNGDEVFEFECNAI